jgi:hypothetical protein
MPPTTVVSQQKGARRDRRDGWQSARVTNCGHNSHGVARLVQERVRRGAAPRHRHPWPLGEPGACRQWRGRREGMGTHGCTQGTVHRRFAGAGSACASSSDGRSRCWPAGAASLRFRSTRACSQTVGDEGVRRMPVAGSRGLAVRVVAAGRQAGVAVGSAPADAQRCTGGICGSARAPEG